jgi:hypothetical protein
MAEYVAITVAFSVFLSSVSSSDPDSSKAKMIISSFMRERELAVTGQLLAVRRRDVQTEWNCRIYEWFIKVNL